MQDTRYLAPAAHVIRKFGGPDGKLSIGIKLVARVTGANPTTVYRWMLPRERGGTDGLIPHRQQMKLFEYARENSLPLVSADFFPASELAVA